MSKLGHDFGRTPFGLEQVRARARAELRCTCLKLLRVRGIFSLTCPEHGLFAQLRKLAAERKAHTVCPCGDPGDCGCC